MTQNELEQIVVSHPSATRGIGTVAVVVALLVVLAFSVFVAPLMGPVVLPWTKVEALITPGVALDGGTAHVRATTTCPMVPLSPTTSGTSSMPRTQATSTADRSSRVTVDSRSRRTCRTFLPDGSRSTRSSG